MIKTAMALSLFVLSILPQAQASHLFYTQDCHPQISFSCPLDPYYQNAPWPNRLRNKFTISFLGLKKYYQHVSRGLIFENPEHFELQDSKYRRLINQNREDLQFKIDYDKMVIKPVQDLSPETAAKLFRFNNDQFNQIMGRSDFLASKAHFYNLTRFDPLHLRFEREILLMSDWKSLIHPPIFKIEEINLLSENRTSPFRYKDYHMELDAQTKTELTDGNKLKLLVNKDAYEEKIRLVNSATRYIFLAVMSFAPSTESDRLIHALIRRSQEGLDVRVIMEGVWTMIAFKKTYFALKKGGVKVELSDDLLRLGRNQGLFHSKYLIIDGQVGVVGGQNLVDRSHRASGYNHFNKDTDVKIEGPLVTDLLDDYIKLWERFSRYDFTAKYKAELLEQKEAQRLAGLRGSEHYNRWLGGQTPRGLCRFISQGPHEDKYKISRAYLSTFSRLEKELVFTSQHIGFEKKKKTKWSSKIYDVLFAKSQDGKPVKLITNGIDGGFLKSAGANPFARFFTERINNITGYLNTAFRRNKLEYVAKVDNFQVWQHFQYIHSKVALVDREVAAIGSYNFETYSAESSYETAVFCQDPGLVKELYEDLRLDMANSTPLVLDQDNEI
jgi:phosphatidylserine/phosphatidylglycerophosphate/cardiolipin synthase-like enzyme